MGFNSAFKGLIILQDVQNDTVHLTYLFHPTRIVWIWQIPVENPHGPQRSLCVITSFVTSFHGIHSVQEMQVSVTMAHNTELVHRLLSGVLKLGLSVNHGSGKGDVAQPQPIH